METINVTIPNMKNSHCQMTVTNTVQALGAKIVSMAPMQATIELGESLCKEVVVAAIEKAGYSVQSN